jgi:hypothetical protein
MLVIIQISAQKNFHQNSRSRFFYGPIAADSYCTFHVYFPHFTSCEHIIVSIKHLPMGLKAFVVVIIQINEINPDHHAYSVRYFTVFFQSYNVFFDKCDQDQSAFSNFENDCIVVEKPTLSLRYPAHRCAHRKTTSSQH